MPKTALSKEYLWWNDIFDTKSQVSRGPGFNSIIGPRGAIAGGSHVGSLQSPMGKALPEVQFTGEGVMPSNRSGSALSL